MIAPLPQKWSIEEKHQNFVPLLLRPRVKAEQAAEEVGGRGVFPTLTAQERAQGLTDWNDLHGARGLEAVTRQVEAALGQRKESALGAEKPLERERRPQEIAQGLGIY
jgi:hypothetical protein